MGLHKFRKGLDLPITGAPEQLSIEQSREVSEVALLAADYPGMKPTMRVEVGQSVRRGQVLFEDKKEPGVVFTSPAAGTVKSINRGAKRAFQSVVVRVDSTDHGTAGDQVDFPAYTQSHPSSLSRDDVQALLIESGLWTALRARPFGRVARPGSVPSSIFVNAMDSSPLAPDLDVIAEGRASDFERGLHALAQLTDGSVFVCRSPDSNISVPEHDRVQVEDFAGPHPAGTVGLHIHTLDPVDRNKLVWYTGFQDVAAIGHLFATGQLDLRRVVSLAGPSVDRPRLLRTRLGASLDELTSGELKPSTDTTQTRVISGSVLSGRTAQGDVLGFLGRYEQIVSVIDEDPKRELLAWLGPGFDTYSVINTFLSKLVPGKKFDLTTNTNGSPRAIIPIGVYERVVPQDLMPTALLKALVVGDIEHAEELGCLELEEEDVALCTFVCPGKIDYASHLRDTLTLIEKEG